MSDSALDELSRAIFGDRLPARNTKRPPGPGPTRFHSPAGEQLLDGAAIVGYFKPAGLARHLAADLRGPALSALALHCDVNAGVGATPSWILRSATRRERLALLWSDRQRLASALGTGKPEAQDKAGKYLVRILNDRRLPPQPKSARSLQALLQALDWLAEVMPVPEKTTELRRRLASRAMRETLSRLLGSGFFGRRTEMRTLREFLAAKQQDPPRPGGAVQVPVLAISGIGGAGKSTFVARAVSQLLDSHSGPLAIAIDFDRFGFSPDSLLELTFELTRQIALQEPALHQPFKDLRHEMRGHALEEYGIDAKLDSPEAGSIGDRLWRSCVERIAGLLQGRGLTRRIVLFLDTFEQAQAVRVWGGPWSSGRDASSRIGIWLEALVEWGGLTNLMVVVSGRAAVEPDSVLGRHVVKKIELPGLELSARRKLLERLEVPPALAQELASVLGGNPLILRIGARMLSRLSAEARDEVLDELRASGGISDELIQGFLYERVLAHVADEKVQRLAHPGLALRLVTWRLIRGVLAGPCNLGSVPEGEAQRLLAALGDEVWLVDRRPGNAAHPVLEHRRDIRSVMLRMMPSDRHRGQLGSGSAADLPDKTATIRKIHLLAVAYHDRNEDPDIDTETAAREAAYHRLMLPERKLRPEDIALAGPTLGDDLEILPSDRRASVKVALGAPLDLVEAAAASEDDWRVHSVREGRARLYDQKDPLAALHLFGLRQPEDPGELPAWYLRAVDAAVRWNEIGSVELDGAQDTLERGGSSRRNRSEQIALSGDIDSWSHRILAEDLLERPAALFQIRFKRQEYLRAFEVASRFLDNQELSQRLFSRDVAQLGSQARALNDAWVALAAAGMEGDRFPSSRLRDSAVLFERNERFQRHDSNLNAELQRHIVLTFRSRRELPRPLWATARAFVPDPVWLDRIAGLAAHGPAGAPLCRELRDFGKTLQRKVDKGMTSSELSSAAAVAFAKIFDKHRAPLLSQEQIDDLDPALLLGDHREFRPSARFALASAFPQLGDLRYLAHLSEPLFRWRPRDLSPEHLIKKGTRVAIALLVDFADSAQVLGRFLRRAAAERPEAKPLRLAAEALSRWEAAISSLCGSDVSFD